MVPVKLSSPPLTTEVATKKSWATAPARALPSAGAKLFSCARAGNRPLGIANSIALDGPSPRRGRPVGPDVQMMYATSPAAGAADSAPGRWPVRQSGASSAMTWGTASANGSARPEWVSRTVLSQSRGMYSIRSAGKAGSRGT